MPCQSRQLFQVVTGKSFQVEVTETRRGNARHRSKQYLCHSTAWQTHGEVKTASLNSPMQPNAACFTTATLLLHRYPHPLQSFATLII